MFLETPRLLLRSFEESDFADYCGYAIDSDMAKMMGRYDFQTAEEARQNFNWLKDKEPRAYLIVQKETGKGIGNLSIYERGYSPERYPMLCGKTGKNFSMCIGRAYRRQGLMYEACSAVIQHLFLNENADYLAYDHFDFNLASSNLKTKLGYTELGREECLFHDSTVWDVHNILWKADWQQQQFAAKNFLD